MINRADLVERLKSAVPAKSDVPGEADYWQMVEDGVAQVGLDAPVMRSATISVVAGTATYALPSDCGSVIEFSALPTMGGVMISTMLIPVPTGFSESWSVEGTSLVIDPVPAYTASRRLRYSAVHVADSNGDYPLLSENMARAALLYGQYLALSMQAEAGDRAGGFKYQIGDESVDKTQAGKGTQALAEAKLTAYGSAISRLAGGYGSAARYAGEDASLY